MQNITGVSLEVLLMLAAFGGLGIGFWTAAKMRRKSSGSLAGILFGGLFSVVIGMQLGYLIGSWGENICGGFGVIAGVFAGCFIGVVSSALAFSQIGLLVANLFGD